MTDTNQENTDSVEPAEKPVKKKRWLKVLLILFILFVVSIGAIFSYINSSAFIRDQVFARIEDDLNQPVKAGDIHFSLFSGIEITDLLIGDDPLLKAKKVKVDYELMPALDGKIIINGIIFEDAEINVVKNRDGKLNILSKRIKNLSSTNSDASDKTKEEKEKAKTKGPAGENPIKDFSIANIHFKNVNLRYFQDHSKEEKVIEFKLKNFNFDLPSLKPNENFEMTFNSAVEAKAGEKFQLENGNYTTVVTGLISQDLQLEDFSVNFKMKDLKAKNDGVELPLNAFDFDMSIALKGKELTIKQLKLTDPRKNSGSYLSASGVIEDKKKIDLTLNVSQVNSALLDLAAPILSGKKPWMRWQEALNEASEGKIAGFGTTIVNYNGSIKKDGDAPIVMTGELNIDKLPLVNISDKHTITNFSTKVNHKFTVNEKSKVIVIDEFTLKVGENGKNVVDLDVNAPVTIDDKNKKISLENNKSVDFTLTNFNLNYLKQFTKEKDRKALKSGRVNMLAKVISLNDGKQVNLVLENMLIDNLSISQKEQSLENLALEVESDIILNDLKNLSIKNFELNLEKDSLNCITLKLNGELGDETFSSKVNVEKFAIYPAVDQFIPPTLKKELGLGNINLLGENIVLTYADGAISETGKTTAKEVKLGGKKFHNTNITQLTDFEVVLSKDKLIDLKKLNLSVISPSFKNIDVNLNGQLTPPAPGKLAESTLNIDVPKTVDVDALLSLLKPAKEQPKKTAPKAENKTEKEAPQEPTKAVDQPRVKLTVNSKVNHVRVQFQDIKDIRSTAIIENDKLTLENAILTISDSILKANGAVTLGQEKEVHFNLVGNGFIDISPINHIINKDSSRQVTGKVEIQKLDLLTKGKTNDDFLNNLSAEGMVNMDDINLKNYAQVTPILATPIDAVLGVNPDHINFLQGQVSVNVKNKVLTLNKCEFQGKSFMVNPTGTVTITDDAYVVDIKTSAGFGGGKLLQTISSFAGGLLNQKLGIKELDKFQKHFLFSKQTNLFNLKEGFHYEKTISRTAETESLSADFLSDVLNFAGQKCGLKDGEISRLQNVTSGKGNLLEEALKFGIGEVEKRQREKNGEGEDTKEVKKKSGSLFDSLINIGINELNKKNRKKKKEAPQPTEEPKVEEKKEEKPIDRKNQLIKGLESLFD
ncbi:MAG: AsmA family protein [Lentisphaeraceae bacterium]|nr:AsmA family protein [Lentisphaeraceae bacterium]